MLSFVVHGAMEELESRVRCEGVGIVELELKLECRLRFEF